MPLPGPTTAPVGRARASALLWILLALAALLPFAAHRLQLAGLASEDAYTAAVLRWALRPEVAFGEWWRLLTAGFVHAPLLSWLDSLHVGSNLLFLLLLGPLVERQQGSGRLALGFAACVLAGNLLSLAWGDELPGTLGASGALFGLVGMLAGRLLPQPAGKAVQETRAYQRFFALFFALQLGSWLLLEPHSHVRIGHAAHLGGFLAGVGLAWAWGPRGSRPTGRAWRWGCLALLLLPLLGAAGLRVWQYRRLFDTPPVRFRDYQRIEQISPETSEDDHVERS